MATVMATSYRQCVYKSAHARTGERTHGRQQGRGADPAAPAGAGPRAGHGAAALPRRWPMPGSRSACRGAISAMRWASRPRRRTGACSISARRMRAGEGAAGRARSQGRTAGRPGRRACRPEGHRGARRQLGAGQGAVVAQRLADQAAALRRRARRALALRRPAQARRGPTRSRPSRPWRSRLSVLEGDAAVREKTAGAVPRAACAKARVEGVRDVKRDRRTRR